MTTRAANVLRRLSFNDSIAIKIVYYVVLLDVLVIILLSVLPSPFHSNNPFIELAGLVTIALSFISILLTLFLVVPVVIFIVLSAVFESRAESVFRQQVSTLRSYADLRSTTRPRLQSKLQGMTDDALRYAACLPDNPPVARELCRDELKHRGYDPEQLIAISVPGFITPGELVRQKSILLDEHDITFGRWKTARNICWGIIGVAWLIVIFALFRSGEQAVEASDFWLFPALGTFALIVARWFRAPPTRVLLLRKFNNQALGDAFNVILSRELKGVGNVILLADKYLKLSWFKWIQSFSPSGNIWINLPTTTGLVAAVICLRLIDRTRWGPPFVGNVRDFCHLLYLLDSRRWLSFFCQILYRRGFLVSSTDTWWQTIINTLMISSDVIILDISALSGGVDWEVENIDRLGLWNRVVMTLHEDFAETGSALATRIRARSGLSAANVFVYRKDGELLERRAFRSSFAAALERSHVARPAAGQPASKTSTDIAPFPSEFSPSPSDR